MGALRMPGTYPLTRDISVIEALASAGSPAADAADYAFIIRSAKAGGPVLPGEDANAEVVRVDLRRMDTGQPSAELMLRDGDTVYVPRASVIFVYGQVRRPGSYPISQDTTIRQALSLAGGLTDFGAGNRIRVVRTVNGKEQEVRVKLQDRVQAGDTIVVPERYF
jgi:polysaccharide export outer membrane protein